jgi:hypothetical protein
MPAYLERAFAYAGPSAWNDLPTHVRKAQSLPEFKKLLKTHFFLKSYK